VFKPAEYVLAGGLALLLLAGCATTPKNGGEAASNWTGTNAVPPPPPVRPVPPRLTNAPPVAVVHTNVPPHPTTVIPLYVWTSLNRWAAEKGLAAPRKTANSPVTTYALSSPRGTLTLIIGSREITWNGITLHLGFQPEIADNQVFVYGLDLQKNIEPLLVDAPPALGTNRIIVIDPGHGGMNGGTVSVLNQRPEKEFTLDCARRLKPLLEAEGWRVFLTRTNDIDLSLSNRVLFAETHHADLFVSLHFNSAAPDRKQNGLETYCLTPVGLPSTLTRGNPDILNQFFPNNAFDSANLQLAVRLQASLLRAIGEEDRGVRRARFMGVLHGQRRPAVLIEGGYLSNPKEAQRIATPEFRQKYAEAIASALCWP